MGATVSAAAAGNVMRIGQSSSDAGLILSCTGKEKKKKAPSFATLRRKLRYRRRSHKSQDHSRAFRELTEHFTYDQLSLLADEYESLSALKRLETQADIARPHASTVGEDLAKLYTSEFSTDVVLLYKDVHFPVHRAVICSRCRFFKQLLSDSPAKDFTVELHTDVGVPLFSALLKYLYSGELPWWLPVDGQSCTAEVLSKLTEEVGMPNLLEDDLRTLLDVTCHQYDALLIFTPTYDVDSEVTAPTPMQLKCHKSILAARSTFFRNLLRRRQKADHEEEPTKIMLDEGVIARRYARVLLHAIYLDVVDLSLIMRGSASSSSLGEVQAMVAGRGVSQLDEIMDVYQIGKFLDLDILMQGCEELMISQFCHDNLSAILRWSSQAHGSDWVYRQALSYLREEFSSISSSPLFLELDISFLVLALQSDFVQASELEILKNVIKWGEQKLMKKMEEREPNLLSHTVHSVTRRGIRRRDLSDYELAEVLAPVVANIRIEHVIPTNSDVLSTSIKRGIIRQLQQTRTITGEEPQISSSGRCMNVWVPGTDAFARPRLFTPYVDELKVVMCERAAVEGTSQLQRQYEDTGADVAGCSVRMSNVPDALYMLHQQPAAQSATRSTENPYNRLPHSSSIDVIAGHIPVPDAVIFEKMLKREDELLREDKTVRAMRLYPHKWVIMQQVHLRVVREFALPDAAVDLISNASLYHPQLKRHQSKKPKLNDKMLDPRFPLHILAERPGDDASYNTLETSRCSDSRLSDAMPDIALASTSMQQLSLVGGEHGGEMQPDLGDSPNASYTRQPSAAANYFNNGPRTSSLGRSSPKVKTKQMYTTYL